MTPEKSGLLSAGRSGRPKKSIGRFRGFGEFRAVVEATGTYRWLYKLIRPLGVVLLAHPQHLRAMVQRRSKTDKLDAQLLANLLRINQISLAYIPPDDYQMLRELTRHRARMALDIVRIWKRQSTSRRIGCVQMEGIRSFSYGLSTYVGRLPEESLIDVISESLALCRQEHPSALPRYNAIDAFMSRGFPDNPYSEKRLALSKEYDAKYVEHEDAGATEESQIYFRRMCAANALSRLFSRQRLTLDVIDDVLDDIAASVRDFKQFGIELEARLKVKLGSI